MVQKNVNTNAIVNGTSLALLLISEKTGGKEWAVFIGTAKINTDKLYLDFGKDKPLFRIFPEWYGYIRTVPDNVKSSLGEADYYLPLTVGDMPESQEGLFVDTGLQWPAKLS